MKTAWMILILIVFSAMIGGCGNNYDKIQIGSILILTGIGSNQGDMSRKGIDLAVKEINQDGGILGRNVTVAHEDNPDAEPATAVTALKNLNARGIDIVIGPIWTPAGLATAPVACEDKILLISPGVGVSEFNKECDYVYNLWMEDKISSTALGKRIHSDGHKRLAILGSQQAWEAAQAEAVKEGYESAGGNVAVMEMPPGDSKDYRTEILRINAASPDAIYIQYSYLDLGARQARDMGIDAPIYTSVIDMPRVESGGAALEGAVSMSSFTPTDWFKKKFFEEYGIEADITSDQAYDAMRLIAEAMRKTEKTDAESVKGYLKGVKSYEGASGSLKFDENRGIHKPFRVVKVEGGKIVEERTAG
ncbi:MAG: ABC transporter substrate-binding protein [Nanoarchaeota archaeon]